MSGANNTNDNRLNDLVALFERGIGEPVEAEFAVDARDRVREHVLQQFGSQLQQGNEGPSEPQPMG